MQWSATSPIPPSIQCTTAHHPIRLRALQLLARNGVRVAEYQILRIAHGTVVVAASHTPNPVVMWKHFLAQALES